MYDLNATVTKDEFVVFSGNVDPSSLTATALNETGFVVIWRELSPNNTVCGQLFDSIGDKQGNTFQINNSESKDIPAHVKVSYLSSNEFIVVYSAENSSKKPGIYA